MNITNSGAVLIPLTGVGIIVGRLITRTGRYNHREGYLSVIKEFLDQQ